MAYPRYEVVAERWLRIKQDISESKNKRKCMFVEHRWLKLSCGHWVRGGGGGPWEAKDVGHMARCHSCECTGVDDMSGLFTPDDWYNYWHKRNGSELPPFMIGLE